MGHSNSRDDEADWVLLASSPPLCLGWCLGLALCNALGLKSALLQSLLIRQTVRLSKEGAEHHIEELKKATKKIAPGLILQLFPTSFVSHCHLWQVSRVKG